VHPDDGRVWTSTHWKVSKGRESVGGQGGKGIPRSVASSTTRWLMSTTLSRCGSVVYSEDDSRGDLGGEKEIVSSQQLVIRECPQVTRKISKPYIS
jgi:hypothetical protein